jgi:hypothetical protein
VRRWMDGDGVMDRDTHMDRQWVCGVYSQLEWFSNAQNALLLRWLLLQAVHRSYMSLPRFPLSVHRNLRSARFPLSLHRTLRSARFPLRCHHARILTAFPRRSHARVRFGRSVSGLSVVGACEACGPCHAPHAVFFFPDVNRYGVTPLEP